MSSLFNIAILGATELVGEALIELLEDSQFPTAELYLLESQEHEEKSYRYQGKSYHVNAVDGFDWSQVDLAFFAVNRESVAYWAPIAADAGVIVIDSSGCFEQEYDVPVVIPEINSEALAEFRNRNIIASPHSDVVQLLLALFPLHQAAQLERIQLVSYQPVSSIGKVGVDELAGQTAKLLNGIPAEPRVFAQQIAFNSLSLHGEVLENGYSSSEIRIALAAQKILNDPQLAINVSCVLAPLFYGCSESVQIETQQPLMVEQAQYLLEQAENIQVCISTPPSAINDAIGNETVFVGRIRQDMSHYQGLNLWLVADNIRLSAYNMRSIAQRLIQDYL